LDDDGSCGGGGEARLVGREVGDGVGGGSCGVELDRVHRCAVDVGGDAEVTAETKLSTKPATVASRDVLRNLDIRRQRDPLYNRKPRKCPSFCIFLHYAPCSF
jgi:hypothetical protein